MERFETPVRVTKDELKELFPACAEIWDLVGDDFVLQIKNNWIDISHEDGHIAWEGENE